MNNKLFIIHFQPLEGYPPILNLLDFFSSKKKFAKITCCSTKGQTEKFYTNNNIAIHRFGRLNGNKLNLWVCYFLFNVTTTLQLLSKRPKNVIYYETLSAFPAIIYKLFINKNANIFIHYHEYATPEEYMSGSAINRIFHQLEQKIYSKSKWISHTNQTRLSKFLDNNKLAFNQQKHFIMPNYPAKNWGVKNKKWDGISPIKFLFIGYSINPNGCFIKELIEWLAIQNHPSIINIYCVKTNSLPKNLIGKMGNTTINILNPVRYQELPPIISDHHIGLILYKAQIQNVIHCAPNKLFEYLACDLDVWFPKEMEGCYPYIATKDYPKVLKLNFNRLNQYRLEELVTHEELKNIFKTTHKKINSNKFHCIPNGFDDDIVFNNGLNFKGLNNGAEKINIAYIGSYYYSPKARNDMFTPWYKKQLHKKLQYSPVKEDWLYRSPFFFFKVLAELFKLNPELKSEITFVHIGKKPEWIEEMVNEFGLKENVSYTGFLTHENMKKEINNVDFFLSTAVKVHGGEDYAIGSKTFDYLIQKKIILGFVTNGAQKNFITESNTGITLNSDNINSCISSLKTFFYDGIHLKPNKEYIRNYCRKESAKKLSNIFTDIMSSST